MSKSIYTATEYLSEHFNIERCPECNCCTGDDTKYKDYSNKNIAICAQCGYEWWFELMEEDLLAAHKS